MYRLNKFLLFVIIPLLFVASPVSSADKSHFQVPEFKKAGDSGRYGGIVRPVRSASLSFAQSGVLVKVPEEGQVVKTGQVVARLDDRKAKISFIEAEIAVEIAKLSFERARHGQQKTERLLKEKIVAPIALTEADFSLTQAEAELKIAEARLKKERLKLEECDLTAPFKGVVVKVMAGVGEQAGAGKKVVELVDLSRLEISVDIPLSASKSLKPGVTTSILIDSRPMGKASVKTIMPLLDPASGLLRVIWSVKPKDKMLAGRYVTLAAWE